MTDTFSALCQDIAAAVIDNPHPSRIRASVGGHSVVVRLSDYGGPLGKWTIEDDPTLPDGEFELVWNAGSAWITSAFGAMRRGFRID